MKEHVYLWHFRDPSPELCSRPTSTNKRTTTPPLLSCPWSQSINKISCCGSVVVAAYDFESGCPGSNLEWGQYSIRLRSRTAHCTGLTRAFFQCLIQTPWLLGVGGISNLGGADDWYTLNTTLLSAEFWRGGEFEIIWGGGIPPPKPSGWNTASSLRMSTSGTRAVEHKGWNWVCMLTACMVAAKKSCVWPHLQWHRLAYVTEIKVY